jgi:hypothetical protein
VKNIQPNIYKIKTQNFIGKAENSVAFIKEEEEINKINKNTRMLSIIDH